MDESDVSLSLRSLIVGGCRFLRMQSVTGRFEQRSMRMRKAPTGTVQVTRVLESNISRQSRPRIFPVSASWE